MYISPLSQFAKAEGQGPKGTLEKNHANSHTANASISGRLKVIEKNSPNLLGKQRAKFQFFTSSVYFTIKSIILS